MIHTPGPLRFAKQGSGFQFSAGKVLEPTDKLIGFISGVTKWRRGEAEANAHRIVAAWNACEGMSTEALKGGVVADLLEALRGVLRQLNTIEVLGEWEAEDSHHKSRITERAKVDAAVDAAHAAIAKAKDEDDEEGDNA